MKEPYISRELMEYLKATFPNQLPSQDDVDLGMIRKLQGIQHVINVLEGLHKSQNDME
jgi:hypothetical protein